MIENHHIVKQDYKIDRKLRMVLKKHSSLLVWFTGLSGSGKSTIANAVEQKLYENNLHTYVLDGDNIRHGLNKDLDFSNDARRENMRRIAEVSNLMLDAGVITLSAFISPFIEERTLVKTIVGEDNYLEIFVDCPIEECERRDVKGLYKKARSGEIKNFTGISSPFEIPENPNLIVKTATTSLEDSVSQVVTLIKNKLQV